jgi:hypothetical protein
MGGLIRIVISKELLQQAQSARQRYQSYFDEKFEQSNNTVGMYETFKE